MFSYSGYDNYRPLRGDCVIVSVRVAECLSSRSGYDSSSSDDVSDESGAEEGVPPARGVTPNTAAPRKTINKGRWSKDEIAICVYNYRLNILRDYHDRLCPSDESDQRNQIKIRLNRFTGRMVLRPGFSTGGPRRFLESRETVHPTGIRESVVNV
uniref:Uncharacterized protein n=1 Tax=Timema cristinae TaxID=61476 RepID=A0A7R9CUB8_TIMCR|nr:unnamed protein product [Timema cristinae]